MWFFIIIINVEGWSLMGDALSHSVVPGVVGTYFVSFFNWHLFDRLLL